MTDPMLSDRGFTPGIIAGTLIVFAVAAVTLALSFATARRPVVMPVEAEQEQVIR